MANYNLTAQTISSSFQQLMQYDRDTGSLYDGTGSLITDLDVTSSYASNVPYDGILNKPTLVSGSSQVDYPLISNIPSGIVSGSIQVTLEDTTFTDGTEFMVLRTDGAGNLSFDYADRAQIEIRTDESIVKGDPLYVTGFSDGQNRVTVGKADASDPSKMPAYGVAYESVSQNTNTQMVALGTLQDIDTQTPNYNVGDTLYVAVGGGLTNVKPTGTNLIQNVGIVGRRQQNSGEILVSAIGRSNDVPNLPTGFAWVGNGSQVATPISTASWDSHTDITSLNQFTASQETINSGYNTFTSSYYVDSSSFDSRIDAIVASGSGADWLTNLTNIPGGIVSGSTQLTGSFAVLNGGNTFVGNQVISGSVDVAAGNPLISTQIEARESVITPLIESTTGTITVGNNMDGSGISISATQLEAVEAVITPMIESTTGTTTIMNTTVISGSLTLQSGFPIEATQFQSNESIIAPFIESQTGTFIIGSNTIVSGSLTLQSGFPIEASEFQANESVIAPMIESQTGTFTIGSNTVISGSVDVVAGVSVVSTQFEAREAVLTPLIESTTGTLELPSLIHFQGGIKSNVAVIGITSNTASVDFADVTMQTLELPASGDTRVEVSNVSNGQVVNLLVKQTGTGTITFGTGILEPSGSNYSPTAINGARDILTFSSFDNANEIYLVNVVNFV